MAVPSLITDLSTTAASNSPAGSDSPALLDDHIRALASFIAQLRDGTAGTVVLITTTTASGASTVDFTSGITSTYKSFKLIASDIHPGTDNVELRILVSTNAGSTWDSTNVYFNSGHSSTTGGTDGGYGTPSQTYGALGGGRGNSATHGGVLEVTIGNLSSTTYGKPMTYEACYPQPAGSGGVVWSAGQVYWSSATAANGLRLYMSSGTISGTFRLYGVQ